MFISDVERCENIMLTLVKRFMERYNGSFITRFKNVYITWLEIFMWVLICLFSVEIAHECKQIGINVNLIFKIVNDNCDVLTTL